MTKSKSTCKYFWLVVASVKEKKHRAQNYRKSQWQPVNGCFVRGANYLLDQLNGML